MNGPERLEDERRPLANLETADPLGLGGLMTDAYSVAQLAARGALVDRRLTEVLLEAALAGLERYVRLDEVRRPAAGRLAFRELGLAIGLEAVGAMRRAGAAGRADSPAARAALQKLGRYDSLRAEIIAFWLEPDHQEATTWTEHRDINDVMLATALAPEGFLVLRRVGDSR